ncbi:unnamed protein product [Clonostachys byssicola]|uniref:Uncharacterized protein n=1 Tax=Clonostachys byssicola TaxID=160290 RepID=A0A9N9V049_9HYPO|nr:unnamed protein product [Clonostachys byssicola]
MAEESLGYALLGYLNIGFIAIALAGSTPLAVLFFVKLHQRGAKSRAPIPWIKGASAIVTIWFVLWLMESCMTLQVGRISGKAAENLLTIQRQVEAAKNMFGPPALATTLYAHLELVLALGEQSGFLNPRYPRIGATAMLVVIGILSIIRFIISQYNNISVDIKGLFDLVLSILLFGFCLGSTGCLLRTSHTELNKIFNLLATVLGLSLFRHAFDIAYFGVTTYVNLEDPAVLDFLRPLVVGWGVLICLGIFFLVVSKRGTNLWDRAYRKTPKNKRNFYKQGDCNKSKFSHSNKSFQTGNTSSKSLPTQRTKSAESASAYASHSAPATKEKYQQ